MEHSSEQSALNQPIKPSQSLEKNWLADLKETALKKVNKLVKIQMVLIKDISEFILEEGK